MAELRTDFIDMDKFKGNFGPEWSDAWRHNDKLKRINRGIMLKAFGLFLLDRGFTHITTSYEGSGDSGDCFFAEGFKDDEYKTAYENHGFEQLGQYHSEDTIDSGKNRQKEVKELFDTYKRLNPEWKPDRDMDALEHILSAMIGYDWYNNEGGSGTVIWKLKKNKIDVEGYQNYYGSYDCKESYDLDGKEPKVSYRDEGH